MIDHSLACAAGLAVAKAFEEENLLANVVARGNQLRSLATAIKSKHSSLISDVRGWGLINGTYSMIQCIFSVVVLPMPTWYIYV